MPIQSPVTALRAPNWPLGRKANDPAVEVTRDRPVPQPPPEAVAILETLFPHQLDALVERLEQCVKGGSHLAVSVCRFGDSSPRRNRSRRETDRHWTLGGHRMIRLVSCTAAGWKTSSQSMPRGPARRGPAGPQGQQVAAAAGAASGAVFYQNDDYGKDGLEGVNPRSRRGRRRAADRGALRATGPRARAAGDAARASGG